VSTEATTSAGAARRGDAGGHPADRYLRTDALAADLAGRSVRSGALRIGAQAVQVVLLVGSGMVLARLLTPDAFGVYAMVLTLTAFVGSFRDFGLKLAAVQHEALDHEQLSALWRVAQLLNLATALFMALMTPVLVAFYDEPRLTGVTLVMALAMFALGLAVQHESILIRQMRFGVLTTIEVLGTVGGVAAGVIAAALGAGYWALVLHFLVTAVLQAAATWIACPWRPSLRARREARPQLRLLLGYGRDLTVFRVVNHVGFNLDRVLVGYFRGTEAMGLYHNAFRWSRYPVRNVFQPLLNVAVAGLSRLHHDAPAYRRAFRRSAQPVYGLVLPGLAYLAADAHNVVLVLLGDQWTGAIPLFRWLCVAAFAGSIKLATDWIYLSQGTTRRQMTWSFVYTPIMIVAVLAGVRWGALGVAIGFTAGTWLLACPTVAYCLRDSHLRISDFIAGIARPLVAAAAAAAGLALLAPALPDGSPFVELMIRMPVFVAAYVGIWLLLPGGREAFRDLLALLALLRRRSRAPAGIG
jgi:PST family polysaccharide transporter